MEKIWDKRAVDIIKDPLMGLPSHAHTAYSRAKHRALERYGNEEFANQQGWVAVGQAGYYQDEESGDWMMG